MVKDNFLKDEFVEHSFEYKSYACFVKVSPLGHRCGYVVLPLEHLLATNSSLINEIEVHGGVTFAEYIDENFVIGFDCAHLGDGRDVELIETLNVGQEELIELLSNTCIQGHVWTKHDVEEELRQMVDSIEKIIAKV